MASEVQLLLVVSAMTTVFVHKQWSYFIGHSLCLRYICRDHFTLAASTVCSPTYGSRTADPDPCWC